MRELLDDFAVGQGWEVSYECMNIIKCKTYRTNVTISRAEGLFESPRNDTGSNFREFDGSDMDGLNK